jgi:hypothetical protein
MKSLAPVPQISSVLCVPGSLRTVPIRNCYRSAVGAPHRAGRYLPIRLSQHTTATTLAGLFERLREELG